MSIFIGAVLN